MNGSGTKRSNKYFSGTNPVNFCDNGLFGIGRKSPPGWLKFWQSSGTKMQLRVTLLVAHTPCSGTSTIQESGEFGYGVSPWRW